jgi:hypothetical protein
MNKNFLNNFYGVLFTPEKTFEEIKETQPLMSAVLIVIFVSMLKVFLYSNFKTLNSPFLYGSNLFMAAFSGIISWLFYAGFFELVAKIFDKGGKYKTFLILSAFALLPWIFLGPVEMYKMLDFSGTAGGVLLGMLVWIWVISLQIYALSKTYELSIGKTVLFILIPSLGWFVFLNWLVGFFTTLSHIL